MVRTSKKRIAIIAAAAILSLLVLAIFWHRGSAPEPALHLAVATNFLGTVQDMRPLFEEKTGAAVRVSSGSTGQLYAQIVNGAPYDVFLAADSRRPTLLSQNGSAVADSRFTYAIGRLVLWSPQIMGDEQACRAALEDFSGGRIAIANPDVAPYGHAARQTLESLGLWQRLEGNVVRGENVMQAFHFTRSGNAQLGFIAASHLIAADAQDTGCHWNIPPSLHEPLDQQAVILIAARNKESALLFMDFLRNADVRTMIADYGYGVPEEAQE